MSSGAAQFTATERLSGVGCSSPPPPAPAASSFPTLPKHPAALLILSLLLLLRLSTFTYASAGLPGCPRLMSPIVSELLLSGFMINSTLRRRTQMVQSFSVVFLYWFYVFMKAAAHL
ncbi:hypothetical protein Taro_044491 [Colocasia esculenta]|uniref:Uncharacterized protein n=1 Tax=Colocasia esculenta TaxID=4460 RepID=A0A843X2U4_COLES|nr:hypothetical protein [Colocasia esculenta]